MIIRKAKFEDAEEITWVHIKGWQESYIDIINKVYLDSLFDSYHERLIKRQQIL